MSNTYHLSMEMYCCASATVDLPKGKSWADVKSWFVKWDHLHVVFKDGLEDEFALNTDGFDVIDWKRPQSVELYESDEYGGPDYERKIT